MRSVFNITRATYINSGHISDYFKECFDTYAVLSINSHNTKGNDKTKLMIYKGDELQHEHKFITLPLNPPAYLAPIYQLLNLFNIKLSYLLLRFKYKIVPDVTVSSFALWALKAHIMQKLGFTKTTVFWLWDYFPKIKGDPYYLLLTIFEPFDKLAINICDNVWYASQSNFDKRVEIGQVKNPEDSKHKVVHWGMGGNLPQEPAPTNFAKTGVLRLVYFGSIDYEKGLDLVFDNLHEINKITDGKFELVIIGGNTPYKKKLWQKIPKELGAKVVDYDFMSLEEFEKYAEKADLGLAVYVPEISGQPNFTYYADPAKPRDYLTYGLPMLITKVPFIYKDVEKYSAGLVLENYDADSLAGAINTYMENPEKYKKGAFELTKTDRYDVYYGGFFNDITK